MKYPAIVLAGVSCAALTACGGGGSSSGSSGGTGSIPAPVATNGSVPTPLPAATPIIAASPSPAPTATSGTSRVTVGGTVLQFAAAATAGLPLTGASVVVGPVPIAGATPPATLPAGDVLVQTAANGAFSATLDRAPAPPDASEPFVLPQNNVLGFVPPASGYYISVFGPGSDGRSAGTPLPLHRFSVAGTQLALHVATASAPEATALATVNADRARNGASALSFDTTAEDVARQHASDESANGYTCHYDAQNSGPATRYLAAGGSGLTGETLALSYGPDVISALQNAETAVLGEATLTPPGGHFINLTDPSHQWAGIAAVAAVAAPGFFNIDEEFVTPNGISSAIGVSGYPATGTCPAGIVNNES